MTGQSHSDFDVILADPPWWYKDGRRSASQHYPLMSVEDIIALPVASIAAENAALFLWTTWPHLFDAGEVMEAWDFLYVTLAWVWVKARRSGFGHFHGMGNYTRSNTEPCLLGIRGSMPVRAHDVLAVIYAPVRQHSRKPLDQYEKINRLYPGTRRLELFARRPHRGWSVWGNEVPSDIHL